MEFTQVDDPFDPWPSLHAVQRLIAECAARPNGHAWTVVGDSGEPPWLSCPDCPADGDHLIPDLSAELDGEQYELGGRTIVFGENLPDEDASAFVIPVSVRVETIRHQACDYGGWEYDVTVHLADREATA